MKLIELDSETTDRCVHFGRDMVRRYAAGLSNRSLAVSSHGAEKNERLQSEGKMAECILSIALGLPIEPLFHRPQWSYDLETTRLTIDVKQTGARGRYLIWPLRKNHLFKRKKFDLLALVKNNWNVGYPAGWIEKWDFFRRKAIAGEGHALTQGTWHVDEGALTPIENLPGYGQAPPSLRIQIAAVEWAAKHVGPYKLVDRALRPGEKAYMATALDAAAETLGHLEFMRETLD